MRSGFGVRAGEGEEEGGGRTRGGLGEFGEGKSHVPALTVGAL